MARGVYQHYSYQGFQKGHPQYFFQHNKETIKRMSKFNKSKKLSEKTKKKLSLSHLGKTSPRKGLIFVQKPYCLDCGIQLKDSRSKRCYKCNAKIASNTYKKGQTSSRKGVKASPETIEKQRLFMLGHKPTLETRKRMSEAAKKVVAEGRHNFYIDGRSKTYIGNNARKIIHKSLQYKLWREAVFKRDNFTCQKCRQDNVYLEADHIKPWSIFPELRFDLNNGRTLCHECHLKTPTWGIKALTYREAVA